MGSGELWQLTFEQLSCRWRTVTYDHRGTGATVNRAATITFELMVGDLFRVLDGLHIDTCVAGRGVLWRVRRARSSIASARAF